MIWPVLPHLALSGLFHVGGAVVTLLADAGASVPRYVPILTPMPLDRWWLLLILPLVVAISLVYKALKVDDLGQVFRQTVSVTAQIIIFLILAAAGLYVISELA